MPEGSERVQVLVIGGGPAGALLAWLLARRGVGTVLVERQRDFAREFRGEVLMPSGHAMLTAAGLSLGGIPHVRPERIQMYRGRKRFFAADLSLEEETSPLGVSQPALLEALVARADESPHFRFLRGVAAKDLVVEDGRVVGARLQDQDGDSVWRARLVVGADGRSSIVRRRQGLPVHDLGAPMDIVWAKFPRPPTWTDAQVGVYLGGGHLLIGFPAAEDRMLQLAWVILKGTYGDLRSRGIEAWAREMANCLDDEVGAHVLRTIDRIDRPFLLDAVTDRVVGWARPGSLVIGDAAHTMSPVGGQGLNVAMRDAVVAANQLVPAFLDGGDVDAAAARVEPERGPEIDAIQRLASFPPRVVLGTRFYHAWARALVARLAPTAIAAGRANVVLQTFLHGTEDVQLRV